MRRLFFLPFIASALLFSSCAVDCVSGSGEAQVRALAVPSFNGIIAEGAISVFVTPGATQEVTIEGQPALLDLVVTEVRNGVWRIRTSKCYVTDLPFIVRIQIPELERIEVVGSGSVRADSLISGDKAFMVVTGSGAITSEEMHAKHVMISLQGSGSITLSGTADRLDAELAGSGHLNAQGVAAAIVEMVLEGSGDATITAVNNLDATLQGSGNVRYRGQPKVISRIEGSGSVAPIE